MAGIIEPLNRKELELMTTFRSHLSYKKLYFPIVLNKRWVKPLPQPYHLIIQNTVVYLLQQLIPPCSCSQVSPNRL